MYIRLVILQWYEQGIVPFCAITLHIGKSMIPYNKANTIQIAVWVKNNTVMLVYKLYLCRAGFTEMEPLKLPIQPQKNWFFHPHKWGGWRNPTCQTLYSDSCTRWWRKVFQHVPSTEVNQRIDFCWAGMAT